MQLLEQSPDIQTKTLLVPEYGKAPFEFDPEKDITRKDWAELINYFLADTRESLSPLDERKKYTISPLFPIWLKILSPGRIENLQLNHRVLNDLYEDARRYQHEFDLYTRSWIEAEIRYLFPDRTHHVMPAIDWTMLNRKFESELKGHSWNAAVNYGTGLALLNKEFFQESTLLEKEKELWDRWKEYILQYGRRRNRCLEYAWHCFVVKMLFPKKSAQLEVASNAENMKKIMKQARKEREWFIFALIAVVLHIYSAQEINISPEKILVVKNTPTDEMRARMLPILKKFRTYSQTRVKE